MRRTFLLMAALAATLHVTLAIAQTAVRCDVGGKTTYGETPCPPSGTTKAIAPTQESAEQKAAAKAASDQIRKDNAYVDKRLDDRYKRDTTRPAVKAAKDASVKKKRSKGKSGKAGAKKDNKSYRSAAKA